MLIDSSGGLYLGGVAVQRDWGEGSGPLLCGRDQFTRRNADACLHCENRLSSETPGIPRPPKGGQLCDLGGDAFLAVPGIQKQKGSAGRWMAVGLSVESGV